MKGEVLVNNTDVYCLNYRRKYQLNIELLLSILLNFLDVLLKRKCSNCQRKIIVSVYQVFIVSFYSASA